METNILGLLFLDIEVRQRNVARTMSTPNASFSQQPPPFSATPKSQMMSPLRGMSPAMQRQFFINNMPPGECSRPLFERRLSLYTVGRIILLHVVYF